MSKVSNNHIPLYSLSELQYVTNILVFPTNIYVLDLCYSTV